MKLRSLQIGLLLAVAAVPVAAQGAPRSPLDRIDEQVREHRYAEAREAIDRWWETTGETVRGDDRARGLYLRAVLNEDLEAAGRDLLRIAVEHPQSPVADRALLRLARYGLARGDTAGSHVYLERLLRDHPRSGARAQALAMLGREPTVAARPATAPAAPAPRPRASAPSAPSRSEATYPRGVDYTVQAGAFDGTAEAESLRDRLRAAGFDAYLARVGDRSRTLVRVGSFREPDAAVALARRLRSAGYPAEVAAINQP